MLTRDRQKIILQMVNTNGSATAAELMERLDASESTVRRDLNAMDKAGLLTKVHGGAVARESSSYTTTDDDVSLRQERNIAEKRRIAKYAASLIAENDFVYMDAGTTTELMIEFIDCKQVTFVTNAINHARKLTAKGYTTYLLGGEFKSITEAIVGDEAISSVEKYNLTKGFFGANGFSKKTGFTTPEIKEAMVKKGALASTKDAYILLDSSKFGDISAITFASTADASIITDICPGDYKGMNNIIEAEQE